MTIVQPFHNLIREWVRVSEDNRPVLSHAQFAQSYGASREYATGKKGKRGGYYVSRDPRIPVEAGGGVESVSSKPFDVEEAAAHFHETKDVATKVFPTEHGTARMPTAKEKSNIHQGVWTDTESGKTYLDISDRVSSLSEGLRRGMKQNQLGVYAAGAGKTLPTRFEDERGFRTDNPRAKMVAESYGKKEEEWKSRSKMSKKKREAALAEMDKDVAAIKARRS